MKALDISPERPEAWAYGLAGALSDEGWESEPGWHWTCRTPEERREYLHGYATGLSLLEGSTRPIPDEEDGATIAGWRVTVQPVGRYWQWRAESSRGARFGEVHMNERDAWDAARRELEAEVTR